MEKDFTGSIFKKVLYIYDEIYILWYTFSAHNRYTKKQRNNIDAAGPVPKLCSDVWKLPSPFLAGILYIYLIHISIDVVTVQMLHGHQSK